MSEASFRGYLRQSTLSQILIGPFVDNTDGKTLESSVAEADWEDGSTKINLHKGDVGSGTALAAFGSGDANPIAAFSPTAIPGCYRMTLTADNLGTAGLLMLTFQDDSIYRPVLQSYVVLPQTQYDAFVKGTNQFPVSTSDMNTIVDKVWDEPGADHVAADSTGAQLETLLDTLAANVLLIMGTGFSTATHSLKILRDYLAASIVPLLTTSTSMSGTGFLSTCVSWIRKKIDEPSTSAKYSNADLIDTIQRALYVVMMDLQCNLDHPIMVRHDITLAAGKQTYTLPSTVGQIIRVAKINSTTQVPEWEIWPSTELSGTGQGVKVEGNTLRFLSDWQRTETLQILYTPTPETLLHAGTSQGDKVLDLTTYQWTVNGSEYYVDLDGGGDPSLSLPTILYVGGTLYTKAAGAPGTLAANEWAYGDNDALGYSTIYVYGDPGTSQVSLDNNNSDNDTLVLDDTPVDGTLDTRLDCYNGYVLRLLSDGSGYIQDRIISDYDRLTRMATVSEAFSPDPTGTVTYEVLPWYSKILEDVVCLEASHDILAGEGNKARMLTIERELAKKKVALRRSIQHKLARFPTSLNSNTSDNVSGGSLLGYTW